VGPEDAERQPPALASSIQEEAPAVVDERPAVGREQEPGTPGGAPPRGSGWRGALARRGGPRRGELEEAHTAAVEPGEALPRAQRARRAAGREKGERRPLLQGSPAQPHHAGEASDDEILADPRRRLHLLHTGGEGPSHGLVPAAEAALASLQQGDPSCGVRRQRRPRRGDAGGSRSHPTGRKLPGEEPALGVHPGRMRPIGRPDEIERGAVLGQGALPTPPAQAEDVLGRPPGGDLRGLRAGRHDQGQRPLSRLQGQTGRLRPCRRRDEEHPGDHQQRTPPQSRSQPVSGALGHARAQSAVQV
jgi:hypothetical protein